jgi:hypothetical protein
MTTGAGTWKLNVTKSKMMPPSPKGETIVIDANDNGIELTDDLINAFDQAMKISYKAKFDGKDYPVNGSPEFDSISFQRVNANTLKAKAKKNGKVIGEYRIVVSKNGKVTTVDYTETDSARNTDQGLGCLRKTVTPNGVVSVIA